MQAEFDIRRLLASTMLLVLTTAFAATAYIQRETVRIDTLQAVNAAPRPEFVQLLDQPDAELVAATIAVELPDESQV